jgi:hypothetical protein
MRKAIILATVAISLIVAAIGVSIARTSRSVTEPMRLHVVERPLTDVVADVGRPGDSAGDILTFHNPIYDATNTKRIGHDQGECTRISPNAGTWQCRWLTYIAGHGAIMVEGAFFDSRESTLAITGGTQEFRNARGSMKLGFRKDGGFDFVYMLLP